MKNKTHNHQKEFRATQRNYDRLSKWYDLLAGSSERKAQVVGLDMLDVKEGDIILEIGFGTGRAILDLAKSVGGSGKVWGVDISAGMTSQARSNINQQGLSDRAILVIGNAVYLPVRSNSYDAIFMSFALELFSDEDITYVLSECRRVLKNGGVIGVVALNKKSDPGIVSRVYEWAHNKFPNLIDCRPIYVQMSLSQAGFLVAEAIEMDMWGIPVQIITAEKQG
jgi:ubiquinone/menaquinone biosynthesis C-methylase UbiE